MNIETFIYLLRLLRPKYYNIITKILVLGGLALISKPIWLDILNVFLDKFEFSLVAEYDWLLGITIIILSLIYNTIHRYMDFKFEKPSEPSYKNIKTFKAKSFGILCQKILPLLNDNKYIFDTTGPVSVSNIESEIRWDLTLWNKLKKEVIVPNNEAIKKLIQSNQNLIPEKFRDVFQRLILHIDAFNEHISNPNFDYTEYQFPIELPKIIKEEAHSKALSQKELTKKIDWLKKKIKKIELSDWFIFGSIVYTPLKANDLDLAVLLEGNNEAALKKLENLKFDFKIKFNKDLHLTNFKESENKYFKEFAQKNEHKIN